MENSATPETSPANQPQKRITSQKALAHAAGISEQWLSDILVGRGATSWRVANDLAGILGCTPDIFMNKDIARIGTAMAEFFTAQKAGEAKENLQQKYAERFGHEDHYAG